MRRHIENVAHAPVSALPGLVITVPIWSAALALTAFSFDAALGETLVVPDDFATIQAAVAAATAGDTVIVEAGRYTENLELRSGVDVRGRETARTLLAPDDQTIATVAIRNSSGVRFANFTLIDASVGIAVVTSSNIEIANIVFHGTRDIALSVDAVSSAEVINSVFFEDDTAIDRGSINVQIDSNIFRGNDVTIATQIAGLDPFANVRSNCFSANADLRSGGVDTGVGAAATLGDPLFVDPGDHDFHLRDGSPCIDAGRGTDVIDSSTGDAGAYGGPLADARPFPVAPPTVMDASAGNPLTHRLTATWIANLDYRVTNTATPGSYRLHYKRGGSSEPPFDGVDAGSGTAPSPIEVGDATTFTLEELQPQAAATPPAPRLLSASGRNEAVIVTWEGVDGATGYRVDYGVQHPTENSLDVGNVTNATITGLTNGETYRFAVSAVNQPVYHVAVTVLDNTQNRNESALSQSSSLAIGAALASAPSSEFAATPELIEAYPELADEGCFIATAAFGADWAAEVQVLRAFRDEVLRRHAAGRRLVRFYYAHGPRAAAFLNEHDALKPLVRAALLPLVAAALLWLGDPSAAAAAVILGALALITVRRCRRARCREQRAPRSAGQGLSIATLARTATALLLVWPAVGVAQQNAEIFSPRWMYELKGGYFYPALDEYATFYGDDRDTSFAVAGSYRLRDWLELGMEIGYVHDTGVGTLTSTGEAGGDVELTFMPLDVFVNFIYQPDTRQRFVPYAGIGVRTAAYEQEIELQPTHEGTSDLGGTVRAGVRWLITSEGSNADAARRRDGVFSRSYLFLEAQNAETRIADVDLGGTTYLIGFRAEFQIRR